MAELVYATDLKSVAPKGLEGSSPSTPRFMLFIFVLLTTIRGFEYIDSLKTLSAEFTRYVDAPNMRNLFAGRMFFKRPGKIFIEYIEPMQKVYLCDSIMWLYFPSERRAVKFNLKKLSEFGSQLLDPNSVMGLNPFAKLEEKFIIDSSKKEEIILYPKDMPEHIAVKVKLRSGKPSRIKMYDKSGRLISEVIYENWDKINGYDFPVKFTTKVYTPQGVVAERMYFKNIKINPEIPDDKFKFKPREGVKIDEM